MVHPRKTKSALTLLDKVNVCLTDFGDHVMHLVFDVHGELSASRMDQAARLLVLEYPILAQKIVKNFWGQPRWQTWQRDQLDQHIFCDITHSTDVEKEIHRFMVEERDYQKEPMLTIHVVRGQGGDSVCIKVSCVPIDGRGFLIFAERLLQIYEILSLDPGFSPSPGAIKHRSTLELAPRFKASDLPKLILFSIRNQLIDARTANNWSFPCESSTTLNKTYTYHQFDSASYYLLKDYCLNNHYTVNDLLLAAYYQALFEIIKPSKAKPYCVLNTYDLRRYEENDGPLRVANYSSFINSNVEITKDTPFEELISRVHIAMNERKARYPGITEAPFIWPLLTVLPFKVGGWIVKKLLSHRGEKIPVFTNVGKINISRMILNGQPIHNVRAFAPLEYPPKLTVTASTAGDVITLSLGYSDLHFSSRNIEYLFNRMEHLVKSVCFQSSQRAVA